MTQTALVLGGGGITGIAWELGILKGLADAGVDLSGADRVIGTSAGSVVGAQVTSGAPLDELYESQLAPPDHEIGATFGRGTVVRMMLPLLLPGAPHRKRRRIGKAALKDLHTPVLYILGGPTDIAYANGMDDFKQINHVPVFVGNLDVGHGGTYSKPYGGEFARVATSWYKWQLKGDQEAGKLFTGKTPGLAQSPGWTVEKKNMD
jgi:hypothetical protein